MKEQWKYFERVVAAIHIAETAGGKVIWNEDIDGRQFDVAIRFKQGLYNYLTLIECKDYQRPVPVEKVEAFVTKSQRAKADKAIMVSSSGYQSGCIEVAKDCKIELYKLTIIEDLPKEMWTDEYTELLNVYRVRLKKAGSKKLLPFSEEYNMLPYLMKHVKIIAPGKEITPREIVKEHISQLSKTATKESQTFQLRFPIGTRVLFPYGNNPIPVSEIAFEYRVAPARIVRDTGYAFDPWLHIRPEYEYENILTGEKQSFDSNSIYPGFDTKFKVGTFYRNINMFMAYYCEAINTEIREGVQKELATLVMVESYQLGDLIQSRAIQETKYAFYNVEVTDRHEIARLKRLYKHLIDRENNKFKHS